MKLPKTNHEPPFRVTRASHAVLTVKDLPASRNFYTEIVGLVVSDADAATVWLRGLEEACHHSLVLKRSQGEPACERVGLRVFADGDLDMAKAHFGTLGLPARFAEVPHQGRTLHVDDIAGTPLEFCATMPVMPRLLTKLQQHRGGAAHRLDHFQILVPEVAAVADFYASLGFRLSEYMTAGEEMTGAFLQRKGNPHDIVFFNGSGPTLHHVAFTVPEASFILRACDIAGNLGFGRSVERGPSRHGPGHALFVYLRDPDGHRVELFTTHYQMLDIELEPVRWDVTDVTLAVPWGLPAQRKWFLESTPFQGVRPRKSAGAGEPYSLEKYLAAQVAASSGNE
jgi:catechol 2,3-dioxygenase